MIQPLIPATALSQSNTSMPHDSTSSTPTSVSKNAGDYVLEFKPIVFPKNSYEFVLYPYQKKEPSEPFHIVFSDEHDGLLKIIQLTLEIEAAQHLLKQNYVNLFDLFTQKQHSDPLFFWGWTQSYPRDTSERGLDFNAHREIENYSIFHCDHEGAKSAVKISNNLLRVIDEIKNIQFIEDSTYATQCRTILEREILAIQMHQNQSCPNLKKTEARAFKI